MKIVTWNCNGAFRKKYHLIDELNADILVIQECENPNESTKEYKNWANDNYLWIGNNKNKGLGIFVKKNHSIELLNWSDINTNYKNEKLESFLPCKINNSFLLLGVWTKHANSEVFGYIGQFWKYLQLHKNKISEDNIIIVGDFNSNSIWDKWDRWWNHSDVVKELEEINIKSLYHTLNNEEQGKEIVPTFYLQRNIKKAYHIDYIFTTTDLINNATVKILEKEKWLEISDHIPIVSEINI
ncbi:MAG: endonuclease/exonuclease/phosphatase family protein [Aliarcobacter sp.]|nr:endonuclease/exonuclease/phosphatase family protein [Aliarcobacter sp.]